tara:strand:+ start:259 stop:546 length:288 start_codon:yes stop_codon:yes gene_type:complete
MSWFKVVKDKEPVDEAIDDLEVVADKYDLDEHDWSSVDDASDYLFEHKVKKILELDLLTVLGDESHPAHDRKLREIVNTFKPKMFGEKIMELVKR